MATFDQRAPEARRLTHLPTDRRGFSAALREAPAAIVTVDQEHRVTSWNRSAEALLGWSETEMVGKLYPLAPGDLLAETLAVGHGWLRAGRPIEFETTRHRKDGTVIPVSIAAACFTGPSGGPEVIAIFNDLSRRRDPSEIGLEMVAGQALLDQAETRGRLGHWRWDPVSRLLTLTDEALRIAGVAREDFDSTYETFVAWVHPEDRKTVESRSEAAQLSGRIFRTRFRVLRPGAPDSEVRSVQVTGQLVRGLDGRAPRMIGIVEDLTERRRLAGRIRSSRRQLRALNNRLERVRGEERAAMARELHDQLGQELTGLKLQLAAFVARASGGEVGGSATHLLALVDQAMQSVRRIAGQLRPPVLDCFGLDAAAETLIGGLLTPNGIAHELTGKLGGWPLDSERAGALYRILQEILTNVVRHAAASRVTISLERTDGDLVLAVEDDGRGIRYEELASPTALGLLGIHERAASFGGTLQIEGAPGRGTKVRVVIPWQERRLLSAAP